MNRPTRTREGWQSGGDEYPGEWVLYGPGDHPDIWITQIAGEWWIHAIYPGDGDFKELIPGAITLEEAQAVALMMVKMR